MNRQVILAMLLALVMWSASSESLLAQTARVAASEGVPPQRNAAPSQGVDGYYDDLEAALQHPSSVIRLNLQNKGLSSIPKGLCKFTNLEELDLSHNQIAQFDAADLCPGRLVRLYLNANQLKEIPASIAQFSKLVVLVAQDNPLERIDPAIAGLRRLKKLQLSGNGDPASFQPAIWGMTGLETLRLWRFGLTSVPDQVKGMTSLKTLCLSYNALATLNPEVCRLPKLDYLNLGKNALQTLPSEIGQCVRLEYLAIFDNPISTLPAEFAALGGHLKWFSAWNTQLPQQVQSLIAGGLPNCQTAFTAEGIH